eukprot:scaffold75946_cov67-Phaeocystis_antarctica.AAC.4
MANERLPSTARGPNEVPGIRTALAVQLWQRHKAASGDLHPERSRNPHSIGQAAHCVYEPDLFVTEGKLKEDTTRAVTGAVAVRNWWNKYAANDD